MTDLNFVFSDENNLLNARFDKNSLTKKSIHMLWKAALREVIHKIAPECSERQVDYAVANVTRKTVSQIFHWGDPFDGKIVHKASQV